MHTYSMQAAVLAPIKCSQSIELKKAESSAGSSSICPSTINTSCCSLSQLPRQEVFIAGLTFRDKQTLRITHKVSSALPNEPNVHPCRKLEGLQRDRSELQAFTASSGKCTYQSRPGLIYTAWDALWCVWWWWRRSRSMPRTGRSRSISSTCTVGPGSCPLNTHRS